MEIFWHIELNKSNKFTAKELGIKRDVKIIIENITMYVPLDDAKSL